MTARAVPTGDDVVDALATVSTSAVSDALDRLGINGQVFGIRRLSGDPGATGRAFTLGYEPVDEAGGNVGDYIDDIEPGSVAVIDNAGRLDATVWGDILTSVAHRRGVAGTVIDGVCRDIAGARTLGYPVFARETWMRTGKDRVRLASTQIPVAVGGVWVSPGDIVRGDADGVVVVPRSREREVLEAALAIERAEEEIRAQVAAGTRLDEARRSAGYFTLQSRRASQR